VFSPVRGERKARANEPEPHARSRKLVAFDFGLDAGSWRLPGVAWKVLDRAGGPQQAQPDRWDAPGRTAERAGADVSPTPLTVAADRARGDISQQYGQGAGSAKADIGARSSKGPHFGQR